MATEKISNNIQGIVLSREEACQLIVHLTQSLGHYQTPNIIPTPPTLSFKDPCGVVLKQIVFAVNDKA
jgi:hypothetical protein